MNNNRFYRLPPDNERSLSLDGKYLDGHRRKEIPDLHVNA
jgi:hypothetical protein